MHDEYYDDTDADYHTTDYIPKMRIVFWPLSCQEMAMNWQLKIRTNSGRFQKMSKVLTTMKNGMARNMHPNLCTMDER